MNRTTRSQRHRRPSEAVLLVALLLILLLGAGLRFYSINWDEGTYHIHPDERHTTMVVTRIEWPASLAEYFDTSRSPLNARNVDMVYFYGTLPLFLTKFVAELLGQTGYDQIHLVGRMLSGLFDLGSVVLVFFLARRLFDWRVGLGSACLLALTALNIQGSHYFAVDTFLTFFVALTIWFTLDVAEGKGWSAFLGLGLAMGLTLACKVSVFLLVAVVALGGWLRMRRRMRSGEGASSAASAALGGLIVAAVIALAVFRIAQPYAWAGPNYDGWNRVPDPWGERLAVFQQIPEPVRAVLMPNPQWIADIVSAGAQQTGKADMPWGRQWTERAAWLWPLENMVLWSLGVPLGLAAWLGVALAAVQVIRGWRRRQLAAPEPPGSPLPNRDLLLIPLAWVLLSFGWQGMQYVKSVRYFLPLHPYLAMFAAFLVVAAWDWARQRRWLAKAGAGGLAAVVLLGTLAWAFAFIQIYTEPVTRVQATRWIYEHVESGATLRYQGSEGEPGQLQIPLPSTQIYGANGQWQTTPFTPAKDLVTDEIVMNHLTSVDEPREGAFEVQIADFGGGVLASGMVEDVFGGQGGERHTIDLPEASLVGGQTYLFQARAVRGAPLISQGSVIANEHFDDPLPFNMFGYLAFGSGMYRSLDVSYPESDNHIDQLPLYDEDTPGKLEVLLDALDQADYIIMSSGRLWQSIPRLPMRYPMTTRYYDLLFAGELGFEKAAEFHSYPRLFGIEFDDTWAEEQFTVYDHPKVLIYRKTGEYDRDRVRALLSEGIDWDSIPHWLNPRDVPEWRREQAVEQGIQDRQNELMLSDQEWDLQRQGGTWASIFDRNSLVNRWPTLFWLLLIGAVGLAVLPLVLGVFQRLPDRGYILARPAGVLLLAWLSWMLTSVTPLHYSRGTILVALGVLAAISYGSLLLPSQRRRLAELWRTQRRLILVNELLFIGFFAIFWLIRWGNPDLWHPWKGGEKPMDFAYLNAVIKSSEFPPYDPWFAGGYLNYYYFGQVMVGTLIKLIGIVPYVAYNLVIPTWFAMTAMGAFSVTYNFARGSDGEAGVQRRPAVLFGLVGAVFVAVLGNLGEIHLLLLKAGEGVLESFQSTIPGFAGLVRTLIGAAEILFGGKALPVGIDEWYWNASRAIPAGPYESVITEFPFFTFLYADLHAHLIAMPLTFLSLALALALIKRASSQGTGTWKGVLRTLVPLFVWALTIGAMRTTNTWDVPPHLLIVLGALIIAQVTRGGRPFWRAAASVAWQFGLVLVLSWWLLYQPFWASYGSYYNSLAIWTGTRTPLWAYLVVHGLFLFAIVSYLGGRVIGDWKQIPLLRRLSMSLRHRGERKRLQRAARIAGVKGLPAGALIWVVVLLLVLLELFFVIPGLVAFTRADPEVVVTGAYAYRGLSVLALGLPVALLGLLALFRPRLSGPERFWVYLVLLGLAMSLGVEVLVLQGDIGRMNTVFKFYLQTWLIWAVAAAVALAWMVPRLRRWSQGRGVWSGVLAALVFFAALYPPLATSAKIRDRFDPSLGPGLDGWEYMETATYWDPAGEQYELKWDLEAIQWMLDNVVGSPVVLEGHTPEYRWGSRYSVNTGLPTVLGWNWHQRQQRAAADQQEIWDRANDVETIYNAPLIATVEPLLEKYEIRYIVVGPLERAYYDPAGLQKFEWMVTGGSLEVAFSNEGVIVYEVIWDR